MENSLNSLISRHKTILDILNDKENKNISMFVGGCVRDLLKYNTISKDIDISTILKPEEVKSRLLQFKKQNKNVNLIILDKDKKYGTIICLLDHQRYEITTTRADIKCYGRKADIKFCSSFEEDSKRRDFTINALFLNIDGKIYDYHNGLQDLIENKINFIGNADSRIKEDYLRIIRFFRFSTKFNHFNINNDILQIIQQNSKGLLGISRERIKSEIYKMLEYKNWFSGLKLLQRANLIREIFLIEYDDIQIQDDDKTFYNNNNCSNVAKLFYFFGYNVKILQSFYVFLRFTNDEKKIADFIIDIWKKTQFGKDIDINTKIKLYHTDKNIVNCCLCLFNQCQQDKINTFMQNKKKLPIKTNDLIQAGYNGENLGKKIKELEQQFIIDNFSTKNLKLG